MATAVETVKNFMKVLTNYSQNSSQVGQLALDDAIRAVTTYSRLDEAKKALVNKLKDTETEPDTDTRLQKATGMKLGGEWDFSVDTGAISGSNAGGSTIKNAQNIVPEDGDLSTAELPTPGSTTPITYTGDDGNSFTFYVKWPDSFTTIVQGSNLSSVDEIDDGLSDSRNYLDLAQFNPEDNFSYVKTNDDGSTETVTHSSYGTIIKGIETVLKGLNTYWLKNAAKLDYDSLGMGLNGQTIEIKFMGGGLYDLPMADTFGRRKDYLPADEIVMAFNIVKYVEYLDSVDQNGAYLYFGTPIGRYIDRVVAHEMVHAVMYSNGTSKKGMPEFFTEGIAELVQGDDDYNSEGVDIMKQFVADPSILEEALGLGEGTGTTNAYPAGDMFMRFIAQQSSDVTALTGSTWQAKTFSYDTGDAVITNYKSSDTIDYQRTIGDAWTSQTFNDLIVKEKTDDDSENLLVLRNVRGRHIYFNTPNGRAYAYMAEHSSEVDGQYFGGDGNGFEILFGADHENNIIRAGNGGSHLWGGIRGNDELFGGDGADTFNYWYNGGHDSFQNVEGQDNIFLRNMTLDQISGAMFTDYGTYFRFVDGGSLVVNGTPSTFSLQDSNNNTTTYNADYQNKIWSLTVE